MTLKKLVGIILMVCGSLSIAGLLFFYSAVLFSDQWPQLKSANEGFRMLFTVPSGIIVVYASFIVVCVPLLFMVLFGTYLFSAKHVVTKTQSLCICLVWLVALLFGFGTVINGAQQLISRITPFSTNPVVFNVGQEIPLDVQTVFKATLKNEVIAKQGMPVEGFEPFMFLKVFPGLTETDFEGAEASIGHYTIEGGQLVHKTDDTKLIHSAAKALTDRGLDTVLANVSVRLKVDLAKKGTLTEIIEALVRSSKGSVGASSKLNSTAVHPPTKSGGAVSVACTMDAKICPDGSAVGRSGPTCQFAACPIVIGAPTPATHMCTADEKSTKICTKEYAPVCGAVAVQCIKAPCPPVPETFSNGCSACAQGNVLSYEKGICVQGR